MKQNKTNLILVRLLFLFLISSFLFSCNEEIILSMDNDESIASIEINAMIEGLTTGKSDSISNCGLISMTDDILLFNEISPVLVHKYKAIIFQFDSNGANPYSTGIFDLSVDDKKAVSFKANLRTGFNQQLFMILSENADILNSIGTVSSISDIRQNRLNLPQTGNLDLKENQVPFCASASNVNISGSGLQSSLTFTLKRAISKIQFDLSKTLKDLTVNKIRIKGIPSTYSLFPDSDKYPSVSNNDVLLSSNDIDVHGDKASITWFIPSNARGIGKNNTGQQKNKILANAPDGYCTYIEIDCTTTDNKSIRFTIFPGADAINDYNLKINNAYNVKMNIGGYSADDPRVEVTATTTDMEIIDYGTAAHALDPLKKIRFSFENASLASITCDLKMNNNVAQITMPWDKFESTSYENQYINKIELLDAKSNTIELSNIFTDDKAAKVSSVATVHLKIQKTSGALPFKYSWGFQGVVTDNNNAYDIVSPTSFNNIRHFTGKSFTQKCDLDFSSFTEWKPLDLNTIEYYGNGFKILNIKLKQTAYTHAGVFGNVKNSTIDGVEIDKSCTLISNAPYFGALAGKIENSTVRQCSSKADVKSNYSSNTVQRYIGGLIGYAMKSSISNSYCVAAISDVQWHSIGYVGGIIAYLESPSGLINNIYAVVSTWSIGNSFTAGGLIGFYKDFQENSTSNNKLSNCYSYQGMSPRPVGNSATYTKNQIGDNYGLGQSNNIGMMSQYFCDLLNGTPSSKIWSWNSGKRPYLTIEK